MRDLQPIAQPFPSSSPRSHSRMKARLVSAALILLVAATAFVAYDVRRETILKCPLSFVFVMYIQNSCNSQACEGV